LAASTKKIGEVTATYHQDGDGSKSQDARLTTKFSSPGLAGGGVIPEGSWGRIRRSGARITLVGRRDKLISIIKEFFLNIFIFNRHEWNTISLLVPFIDIRRGCMKRHIRLAGSKRNSHGD
jgi:hypothetical protein